MWYVCDVLYAVLYVRASCFVVRGCAVSRRYLHVCNCDMFSIVNVYLDHLKFCVVCINGRRYVCCSECYVVSDECIEPTSCLVQPIGTHGGEVSSLSSSSLLLIPFILTRNIIKFILLLLLGLCPSVVSAVVWSLWSVCEVVVVPYVDAVVAVTTMRVLLHVCMLRECEGAKVTAMLVWGMAEVWLW